MFLVKHSDHDKIQSSINLEQSCHHMDLSLVRAERASHQEEGTKQSTM